MWAVCLISLISLISLTVLFILIITPRSTNKAGCPAASLHFITISFFFVDYNTFGAPLSSPKLGYLRNEAIFDSFCIDFVGRQ